MNIPAYLSVEVFSLYVLIVLKDEKLKMEYSTNATYATSIFVHMFRMAYKRFYEEDSTYVCFDSEFERVF